MLRLGVIVVFGLSLYGCQPQVSSLGIGDKLPLLHVRTTSGETIQLPLAKNKLLVLNLWAVWCRPCREEMPSLQRLATRMDRKRFQVVGLAVETDGFLVAEFLRQFDIHFPVYLITQKQAEEQLSLSTYPETLLITTDGTVQARIKGAHNWDKPEVQSLLERFYRGERFDAEQLSRVFHFVPPSN